MARITLQEVVNQLASTTGKSTQEALNILAGYSGTQHTEQECWNKLATGSLSSANTSQGAGNVYAGTSGKSLQDSAHSKKGIAV